MMVLFVALKGFTGVEEIVNRIKRIWGVETGKVTGTGMDVNKFSYSAVSQSPSPKPAENCLL